MSKKQPIYLNQHYALWDAKNEPSGKNIRPIGSILRTGIPFPNESVQYKHFKEVIWSPQTNEPTPRHEKSRKSIMSKSRAR